MYHCLHMYYMCIIYIHMYMLREREREGETHRIYFCAAGAPESRRRAADQGPQTRARFSPRRLKTIRASVSEFLKISTYIIKQTNIKQAKNTQTATYNKTSNVSELISRCSTSGLLP